MTHIPRRLPPVLLLHGLGGTSETLGPIGRALEGRGFSVTHPTLAEAARRATLSGAGLANVGLDSLLDEARTYAERIAARGTRPIICGHSNGALLALALGSEDLAAGVVLMAPAPSREVARTLLPDSGRVLCEAAALKPGCWFDPEPPLDVPCAMLAGDRDRIVPLKAARRIAARYDAEVHVFQGAGHWFPADDAFAEQAAARIAQMPNVAVDLPALAELST